MNHGSGQHPFPHAAKHEPGEDSPAWLSWSGMFVGPLAAAALYLALPAHSHDAAGAVISGLSDPARANAAVAALMAVWWITQAVPIEATALVPLVLFPLLGITTFEKAAAPYANEQVFLFLGGFMLGLAVERWGLHKRIAYLMVLLMGSGPVTLVGGLMFSTAFVSLWISNTATAIVMLPIAVSMITLVPEPAPGDHAAWKARRNFGTCAVTGVGYAASIGGCGTIIGTPPNGVFVGFVRTTLNHTVQFNEWLWVGLPLVAVMVPIVWLLLTRVLFPMKGVKLTGARSEMRERLRQLGPTSRGEKWVLAVFGTAILLWIVRVPFCHWLSLTSPGANGQAVPRLTDSGIAMTAALVLFLIPTDVKSRQFVLDWDTCKALPWGVLLMFGGGLSLAAAITATGLDTSMGSLVVGLGKLPTWALVAAVSAITIFLSEFASNVALVATMLPVVHAVEVELKLPPGTLLLPTTLAASLAFMLPVATPPNALMYATRKVSLAQMLHAGLWLDVVSLVLVVVFCRVFGEHVLKIMF